MALFAIGDLHGHLRALEALLAVIPRAEADPLIFLGDYVDKGPEVCGVLDRLCQLAEGPETYFLRGNHDQMLLDAASDATLFGIWECLAGDRPLASYGAGSSQELLRAVPHRHWDFLAERTLPFFETADFIFVHGGIRPDRSPAEEDPERLQ